MDKHKPTLSMREAQAMLLGGEKWYDWRDNTFTDQNIVGQSLLDADTLLPVTTEVSMARMDAYRTNGRDIERVRVDVPWVRNDDEEADTC